MAFKGKSHHLGTLWNAFPKNVFLTERAPLPLPCLKLKTQTNFILLTF